MNDWSADDMRHLQEEAKKRVLEMKERSRFAAEDMDRSINSPDIVPELKRETVKAIKMPVELPDNSDRRTGDKNPERKAADVVLSETKKPLQEKTRISLLNLSGEELERLFVMSLCLLLSYEQSDEELMLAMMYLLT